MARMRCNTSSKSKVESTACPASYRTAILFISFRGIVPWQRRLAEVPKVTRGGGSLGSFGGRYSPQVFCCRKFLAFEVRGRRLLNQQQEQGRCGESQIPRRGGRTGTPSLRLRSGPANALVNLFG